MAKRNDTVASSGSQLSRRSLFTHHAPALVALVTLPQLLSGCGTEGEAAGSRGGGAAPSGQDAKSAKLRAKRKRDASDAEEASARRTDDVDERDGATSPAEQQEERSGEQATDAGPDLADADADADDDFDDKTPSPEAPQQQPRQEPPVMKSNIAGAAPDGGFFSSGAPTLTREQIEAGQQVRGKCEGGQHDLIIEPEHLAALARGETVRIKSSTQTHLGNPTVHNHTVTYTPMLA